MAVRIGNNAANTINGTVQSDQIFGLGGADTINGRAGDDFIAAGAGADLVRGGAGQDVVFGGLGDDRLLGQGGDDVLLGGLGDDRLLGGAGEDIVDGGNGADVLIGGRGSDILEGGNDADVFLFQNLLDSAPGAIDLVLDFSRSEGDKVDLRGLNLDLVGANADDISFTNQGGSRFLRVNTDNDAAFELVVEFEGQPQINATDLLV